MGEFVISEPESESFGYRIARSTSSVVSRLDILSALTELTPDILVVRVKEPLQIPSTQYEIGFGPIWGGTTVEYELDLGSLVYPRHAFFPVDATGLPVVAQTLRAAFAGYRNHHSANFLLSGVSAAAGYEDWLTRHVTRANPNAWIGAVRHDSIVAAFVAWEIVGTQAVINLYAVHPSQTGLGLGVACIRYAAAKAQELGASNLRITTQAHNVASQRAIGRAGGLPRSTWQTFHINALLTSGQHGPYETLPPPIQPSFTILEERHLVLANGAAAAWYVGEYHLDAIHLRVAKATSATGRLLRVIHQKYESNT